MTVVETPIHQTEDERVAHWRLEQLQRAGYDETAALVLADLVRNGCPSDTALRILL
jgi:hypothetical protein